MHGDEQERSKDRPVGCAGGAFYCNIMDPVLKYIHHDSGARSPGTLYPVHDSVNILDVYAVRSRPLGEAILPLVDNGTGLTGIIPGFPGL